MKKYPDHNSTDSSEIEALIARLERGQLRDEDAQLLARLLRFLMVAELLGLQWVERRVLIFGSPANAALRKPTGEEI